MPRLTIQKAYQQALGHYRNGMLAEAAEITLKILDHDPRHLDSLHLMGLIACYSGRDDLAIPYFVKACELAPHSYQLLSDLGEAHRRAGDMPSAITALKRAIALKPDHAEAHNNLGATLLETGNLDEAANVFLNLVSLNPTDAEVLVNLGTTLSRQGKHEAAITAYQQAIVIDPTLITAFRNLGNALEKCNRLDEAIEAYKRALKHDPELHQVHNNLGNAWKSSGRIDLAISSYRRALAASPGFQDAHSNLLFSLHYSPEHDARAILDEHRHWNLGQANHWQFANRTHVNSRDPLRRLRVGYVSPDFRDHPVSGFLLPLLENHDKSGFELYAYTHVSKPDSWTERILSRFEHHRDLLNLTDEQASALILEDGIDILVDLALHTAGNRLPVFGHKPAPVQATWLAYAGTSGLDAMDYRISDPHLDPPDSDDSVYSENTVRLPSCYWCYQPEDCPDVESLPAMRNGFVTFGSLNNFCKVNDGVLNLWTRILKMIPDSRLHLHANEGGPRTLVVDFMQRSGIDPQRVVFIPDVPIHEYHRQYHGIDIALDPFPYGGGTTTCDALWMGAPLITLRGKTAVGRGGASIVTTIGLPELVADNEDDYLTIAVKLAHDLPRLAGLRTTLRDRMRESPLMNPPLFAKEMETAYRDMWRSWCENSHPG